MGISLRSIKKPMEFAQVPVGRAFCAGNGRCHVKQSRERGGGTAARPGAKFGRYFNATEMVFPTNWSDAQILAWLSDPRTLRVIAEETPREFFKRRGMGGATYLDRPKYFKAVKVGQRFWSDCETEFLKVTKSEARCSGVGDTPCDEPHLFGEYEVVFPPGWGIPRQDQWRAEWTGDTSSLL